MAGMVIDGSSALPGEIGGDRSGESFIDISRNGSGLVEHEVSVHERGNTSERMQVEIFGWHIRCERIDLDMLIGECWS